MDNPDETGLNRNVMPIAVSGYDGRLRSVWPKQYQTVKPMLD